jgi:hypothetical protein
LEFILENTEQPKQERKKLFELGTKYLDTADIIMDMILSPFLPGYVKVKVKCSILASMPCAGPQPRHVDYDQDEITMGEMPLWFVVPLHDHCHVHVYPAEGKQDLIINCGSFLALEGDLKHCGGQNNLYNQVQFRVHPYYC